MRDGSCTDMSSCWYLLISCNVSKDHLCYATYSSQSFSVLSLRGSSVVSFITTLLVNGKRRLLGMTNPLRLLIFSCVVVQLPFDWCRKVGDALIKGIRAPLAERDANKQMSKRVEASKMKQSALAAFVAVRPTAIKHVRSPSIEYRKSRKRIAPAPRLVNNQAA
jgi:hypothetical protein